MNGGSVRTFDDELIGWLQTQPDGPLELRWYCNQMNYRARSHIPPEEVLGFGWLDIQVPEIEAALGSNWVWTIVAEREGHDSSDEVVTTPDVLDGDRGPAWLASTVSRSLAAWCLARAQREVTFVWDYEHGPSPMVAGAIEIMEGVERGEIETHPWDEIIHKS